MYSRWPKNSSYNKCLFGASVDFVRAPLNSCNARIMMCQHEYDANIKNNHISTMVFFVETAHRHQTLLPKATGFQCL